MSWLKEKLRMREQLKELNQIADFLIAHLKEWENRKDDIQPDIFKATCFIFEELIDVYGSIQTLYSKKHLESCIILARTVLENAVNLKYIHDKESERRAHNFIVFPMKSWLKRADKYANIDIPKKQELISKIKKEVETYNPTGNKENHWDGRTMRELFEELKLENLYTEGYTRLSGFTHPHYKSGVDMFTERPYFDFIRKLLFRDILVVTLSALKTINEKYDLLEGGMIIEDYPEKGMLYVFSINNKTYKPR